MMKPDEKCAYTGCRNKPQPENKINSAMGEYYYCNRHWTHAQMDMIKPSRYPWPTQRPTNRHPNFPWLAAWAQDPELRQLFGSFQSFRATAGQRGYRLKDLKELKEYQKKKMMR